MSTEILESAVIGSMLDDSELSPGLRSFDPLALVETERNFSQVGFITSFARTSGTKLFGDNISMRWGKVSGRLNSEIDVGFIVYVDDGYLTGVEGFTYGGELWPSEVRAFELTDLPDG